jgi:hypothetical protein
MEADNVSDLFVREKEFHGTNKIPRLPSQFQQK